MAVSPSTMATLVAARDAAGAAYALAAKAYIDAYIELKAYDEVLSNNNVITTHNPLRVAGWGANVVTEGPGGTAIQGQSVWGSISGGPLPTFPSTLPDTLIHAQYARSKPYPNESYATKAAARRDQLIAPLNTSAA